MRLFFLASFLMLAGCANVLEGTPLLEEKGPLTISAVSFSELPGWGADDLTQSLPALKKSCARILKGAPDKQFGSLAQAGTNAQWQRPCRAIVSMEAATNESLKLFLETYFQPYEVRAGSDPNGLFTGYYEAALRGSRTKHGPYQTPLYKRPADLVMVNLGEFREELKGQRIAGRVIEGQLKPYEDRSAIVAGNWPHNDEVLVWVDDPVDAFFVQVQGSGVIEMDDGSVMRIGYAGQNGHIYYAVGRELVQRGHLAKENVSMQTIRAWLEAHPGEAHEILNTNRSYVFFKEQTGEGPMGGEGIALTPGRSLAIDRSLLPYGMPFWLETQQPKLNRLMVAQDTGGAITGPVRGDVFWGFGAQAEAMAGPMKSPGRYWIFIPKQ